MYQTYQHKIYTPAKLDAAVEQIKLWVCSIDISKISNSHQSFVAPAIKAVDRLTKLNQIFLDPKSQINLKQLLALVWLGVNDADKLGKGIILTLKEEDKADMRIEILNDAKLHLIEGLYDIQRGNNNNNFSFIDNGQADNSICYPGAFNKLVQILWFSGHVDVDIIYLSHETAIFKASAIVKDAALKFLLQLDKESNCSDQAKKVLLAVEAEISKNYFLPDSLWLGIKEEVIKKVLEEFGSIYNNNPQHFKFQNLISRMKALDMTTTLHKLKHPKSSVNDDEKSKSLTYHSSLTHG